MAASLQLLPGSTVRWRGRRYLIVDYESLAAIIARQPGKRRLERIPVNEAAPDHASHIVSAWTPDLASVPEAVVEEVNLQCFNCVNSLAHWQIITESESIKEPRGRSRSQSYSQIALLHSHLFLHDQLTFADISGTDNKGAPGGAGPVGTKGSMLLCNTPFLQYATRKLGLSSGRERRRS